MMNKPRFSPRFLCTAILFVVVCACIYYVQHLESSVNETVSKKDPFERALDQIEVCNARDRPRQRALLVTMQAWSEFARKYNLQYWISFGTLVGHVQGQSLLPYSVDLAVTMMAQDTPRLISLVNRTFMPDYALKIHPDWFRVGYLDRSYYPNKDIQFVAPNAQFVNRKENVHIDIYPSYDYDPITSMNLTIGKKSANLTEYDPDYDWISYPREWTFPLNACYLSGLKILCPANPEKLVKLMFGRAALSTSDTFCMNGTWIESDKY